MFDSRTKNEKSIDAISAAIWLLSCSVCFDLIVFIKPHLIDRLGALEPYLSAAIPSGAAINTGTLMGLFLAIPFCFLTLFWLSWQPIRFLARLICKLAGLRRS
jgi:hypothetical protein